MIELVQNMAPDWEKIAQVVECPLCAYNLRGLSDARCPECGYTFLWLEILDATRRKHKYLFEHHPERNFWSFFKTLAGERLPWQFWKTLHPTQPADEARLSKYRWIIRAIASLPMVITGLWIVMMSIWPGDDWPRRNMFYHIDPFAGHNPSIMSELIQPFIYTPLYLFVLIMTVLLLALPEMSAGALLIYRSSMRQAKIQKHHVNRCVTYSYDVLVWPIAAMTILGGIILFWPLPITSWEAWLLSWCLLLLLPGAWLLMSIQLAVAYRHYLRMKHAVAAVVAAQLIVMLAIMVVLLLLKGMLPEV